MNEHEFLVRVHGPDYKDDSTRIRAARYVFRSSPNPCDLHEMARAFEFTTEYGPAVGEPCTAKHVRAALAFTKRRCERHELPFRLVDLGSDRVVLAPYSGATA